MKVGSRGDYGLRALVYLAALRHTGEPVQIHAIAQRQEIPEDYLRQLMVNLRLAGLVTSVRGPHGGYQLAKDPQEITMAQVIEVLEGPPEHMHCSHEQDPSVPRCGLLAGCNIRSQWHKATEAMQSVLRNTTLADLAAAGPL